MICSECGTENLVGAKFCMECATRFTITCPNCGASNLPAAKFCSECASPIGGDGPRAPAVRASAPAPDAIAERRLVSETSTRLGARPLLARLEDVPPVTTKPGPLAPVAQV